ncbi:hypothetical protein AMTRI_Chr04g187940 [Amborella trichopoda]
MRHDSSFNTTTASTVHSPWHSPVPYLFGGLAAMLGLIAFALLILACSFWKLSENNGKKQGEPIKGLPDLEQADVLGWRERDGGDGENEKERDKELREIEREGFGR